MKTSLSDLNYQNHLIRVWSAMPDHFIQLIDPTTEMRLIETLKSLESEFEKHGFKIEFSRGDFHAEKIITRK